MSAGARDIYLISMTVLLSSVVEYEREIWKKIASFLSNGTKFWKKENFIY